MEGQLPWKGSSHRSFFLFSAGRGAHQLLPRDLQLQREHLGVCAQRGLRGAAVRVRRYRQRGLRAGWQPAAACSQPRAPQAARYFWTSRLPLAVTGQGAAGSLGVLVKLPPEKRELEHGRRRVLSRAPAQKCKWDAPADCRARPSSSCGPIARSPLHQAAGRAQAQRQQVRMAAGLPRHRWDPSGQAGRLTVCC